MQHSHTIHASADYRQGMDHSSAHSAQVHVSSQTLKENPEHQKRNAKIVLQG